jgi:hypothetical protein
MPWNAAMVQACRTGGMRERTTISRTKRINGGRLTCRTCGAKQNEVAILIKIANRNRMLARPHPLR